MLRVANQSGAPAQFLALGDSYTIGEGVSDDQRWPVQLAAALRARGVPVTPPHIIARSGWTTDELMAAIDEELAQGQLRESYGLVSLQIGVNNQYRDRPLDEYREQFTTLLDRAIAFAGNQPAQVLALSTPDWGQTPFGQASGRDRARISRHIDDFNHVASEVCRLRGVAWVDVTPLTRQPALQDLLVADGLHPSGAMYAHWVEAISAAMAQP